MPSRAPSMMAALIRATASGWLSFRPRARRRSASRAAVKISSLSRSRGVRSIAVVLVGRGSPAGAPGSGAASPVPAPGAEGSYVASPARRVLRCARRAAARPRAARRAAARRARSRPAGPSPARPAAPARAPRSRRGSTAVRRRVGRADGRRRRRGRRRAGPRGAPRAIASPAANQSVARVRCPAQPSGESSSAGSSPRTVPRSSQRPGSSIDWVKRPATKGWSDAGRPSAVRSQPIISAPGASAKRARFSAMQPL